MTQENNINGAKVIENENGTNNIFDRISKSLCEKMNIWQRIGSSHIFTVQKVIPLRK